MQLRGLDDLLLFLNFLNSRKIWYRLEHLRDDAVMVSVHMVGTRLEVEFFKDRIEYSNFEGDESVFDDQDRLFALIEDRGSCVQSS